MYVCIDVHVVFNFKIHSGEPHTQTSLQTTTLEHAENKDSEKS